MLMISDDHDLDHGHGDDDAGADGVANIYGD